jgi:hypothetical protein
LCLQDLNVQREQLQEQLAAVKGQMDDIAQRVAQAQQEHREVQAAAASKLQALQQKLRRPDLQAPASATEARQLLAQIQQQFAEEQKR